MSGAMSDDCPARTRRTGKGMKRKSISSGRLGVPGAHSAPLRGPWPHWFVRVAGRWRSHLPVAVRSATMQPMGPGAPPPAPQRPYRRLLAVESAETTTDGSFAEYRRRVQQRAVAGRFARDLSQPKYDTSSSDAQVYSACVRSPAVLWAPKLEVRFGGRSHPSRDRFRLRDTVTARMLGDAEQTASPFNPRGFSRANTPISGVSHTLGYNRRTCSLRRSLVSAIWRVALGGALYLSSNHFYERKDSFPATLARHLHRPRRQHVSRFPQYGRLRQRRSGIRATQLCLPRPAREGTGATDVSREPDSSFGSAGNPR